jgi:hypothetical protein
MVLIAISFAEGCYRLQYILENGIVRLDAWRTVAMAWRTGGRISIIIAMRK